MATKSKEEVVQEFRIHTIQEATMRVIARKGMAAATVQEIADEAGVAKGTIYLYFRDREDLVEKTFDGAMNLFLEQLDAAIALDVPFEQKLRAIMEAKIRFFSANREFFRLYLSLRMPEGSSTTQRRQKQHCQPKYRDRTKQFTNVLKAAMDRGEIRAVDPQRLALFIIEGSTAIILERLGESSSPAEKADVDFIVDFILEGVRKRSGR